MDLLAKASGKERFTLTFDPDDSVGFLKKLDSIPPAAFDPETAVFYSVYQSASGIMLTVRPPNSDDLAWWLSQQRAGTRADAARVLETIFPHASDEAHADAVAAVFAKSTD